MTQSRTIKQPEAMEKIANSRGRFISVKFKKRSTGKLRKISGRIGVRKGVKGVGMSYTPSDKGLWTIWDKDDLVHKSIPEEILELSINKEHFIIEEKEVVDA